MRQSSVFIAIVLVLSITAAGAQNQAPAQGRKTVTRHPLRIEVSPFRMQRLCTGGYALERRASGDTIVPRLHCRWAG